MSEESTAAVVQRHLDALSEDEAAALARIVAAPHAWTEINGDAVVMTALEARGLVVMWDRDRRGRAFKDGPYASLTPLAAHRLAVILVERGPDDHPVWREAARDDYGDPILDETPLKPPRWGRERSLEFAETIADGAPSPVDEAIMAEEFLMRERRTPDGQFVVDPNTGQVVKEVVTLFGMPVRIDRKGKGKRTAKKRARRRPA